jgi:hypothetical protein
VRPEVACSVDDLSVISWVLNPSGRLRGHSPRRTVERHHHFRHRKNLVHRLRIHLTLSLAIAALAMTFAASAAARRAPTPTERAAINGAVYAASVYLGVNRIPRSHYQLTNQQVSTVSPSWATADLTTRRGFRLKIGDSTVVEVRIAGTQHWVVVDVGPAFEGYPGGIACGIAPNNVLADLFLDPSYCVGGNTS